MVTLSSVTFTSVTVPALDTISSDGYGDVARERWSTHWKLPESPLRSSST